MTGKQLQALESLKAFNQAITTTRLYPALSPQVANAVEKAYQAIKSYLRQGGGEFSFGVAASGPLLCGRPVGEDGWEEIKELIVYRQLELLKLEHAVFRPQFDRKQFAQILTVFTARKEKVNREGGGRAFADSLGLAHFFPDDYTPPEGDSVNAPQTPPAVTFYPNLVPKAVLGYLFGEHGRPETGAVLTEMLGDEKKATDIVVAGIALVLDHLGKEEYGDNLVVSATYSRFLQTVGSLLPAATREAVAGAAATTVLRSASDRMLSILFAQKYPEGFAHHFFGLLTDATPNELFDAVMAQLHGRAEQYVKSETAHSPQAQIVENTRARLLETRKGKQYLGREKARALIQSGEKQRQGKRLEAGIKALLGGNTDSLKSDEVVFSLPSTIDQLLAGGQSEDAGRIVDKVAGEMLGGDAILRQRLIQSLILIGEKFLDDERWDWLGKIVAPLLSWLREADSPDFTYEKTAAILQACMNQDWRSGNFERGDLILNAFHKIRSGQLPKSPPVLALVGRIQDRIFNRPQLERFLERYLTGGDGRSGERLTYLGRPAGLFLMDALLQMDDTGARLKIIELLAQMGPVARPLLLERLPEPMPWYGKRNLIKLLEELGGPSDVEAILPYLQHEDIRVQREAFACIYLISGDQRKQALLRCLDGSSEAMRGQVVKALLPFSDAECAAALGVILEDQENYSDSVREPLIREVLKVLARSGATAGREVLKRFLGQRRKKANRKLGEAVWQAAETALKQVEATIGPAESAAASGGRPSGGPKVPVKRPPVDGPDDPQQSREISALPGTAPINELLAQGKKELAKESLLELIGKLTRERRFGQAEQLREWLIKLDPMALTEIIRAAEMIEEAKVAAIDRDHLEAWSDLYDVLTTEEFATLYHAMARKTFNNEEVLVRQGSLQSGLYFIASGKVKVFFRDKGGDTLIKVAVRGDILGAETVFDASVWTVGAACLMRAEVMVLAVDTLIGWREEYPALESKLNDFCMRTESFKQFFAMSGRDRRTAKRHKVEGRISMMLLDNKGGDTGISSKGDLFDVASGGISFYLRISQKKNARLLLGRMARILLPMEGGTEKHTGVVGTIIAIRGHQAMESEYSVHVKFKEELTPPLLQAIILAGKSDSG